MKKIFFAVLIAMISTAAFAQSKADKDEKKDVQPVVPAAVTQAFVKDYPSTKVTWEEEDGNYEASFKVKGTEASATYNPAGYRLETEMEIKVSSLPPSVAEYVSTNYHGFKVTEATKMTDDKGVVTYEAEASKDGHTMNLIFDAKGKYLKQGTAD